MNYFAKYLRVKGKIKEGDVGVMLLKNNVPIPHKLFLCSRDIQVGDECYHIKFPELGKWAIKDGDTEDCVDWHGENVDEADLYKVIGEISPEATWVKEGDEFDFEDLSFSIYPPDHEKAYEVGRVQIKCKCCNTFK